MDSGGSSSEDDSSSEVYITKASSHDLNDILRIYDESKEFLDDEDEEWFKGIIKSRSRRVNIYTLRINGGSVIGFAVVYKNKRRKSAYIDSLALEASYRGRGFGRVFLEELENLFRKEGFEKIYLTVKHNNLRALSLYLKRGFRIKNLVLILGLEDLDKILRENINSVDNGSDNIYRYKISLNPMGSNKILNKAFLEAAIWNRFTGEPDEIIYRKSREKRIILRIYRGKKLIGLASICIDREDLFIERLAVAFNKSSEAILVLLRALEKIFDYLGEAPKTIMIPVDASKTTILDSLLERGFRIIDTEYVVIKDLREDAS
ncbi:MAG: GNAT family N-acetyltransferase [Sulfolobales archaeon]